MPQRGDRTPMAERLLRRAVISESGCWEWQGRRDKNGYGRICITLAPRRKKFVYTHRMSYATFRGPLDPALVIDHLCRNTKCLRPDHLEQVTNEENLARADRGPRATETHCRHGHAFDAANTYVRNGTRQCRACNRAAVARYAARRRGAVTA